MPRSKRRSGRSSPARPRRPARAAKPESQIDPADLEPGMAGSKIQRAQDAKLLKRGWYFDVDEADRVCAFIERYLRHSKGEWAGQLLTLAPWQRAYIRRLFGWRRPDGTRRYRRSYVWIPRKNGKSTLAAAIALFLTLADGEPGAEVYSAATEIEQAKIVFDEAKRMVEASPDLTREAVPFKEAIQFPVNGGIYRVLSSKSSTKHGLNVHGVIIDEVHALRDRSLYDVLTSGSGSRRQPLEVVISTAGDDIGAFGFELWEYSLKVRDGVFEDPEFLPLVYCADEADDWSDPATWRKANPNLGVSVKEEFLKGELSKVEGMPGRLAHFRQVYLNIWTQSVSAWLSLDHWRKCAAPKRITLAEFAGRKCWGGLDLSQTTDLTSLQLVFPDPDPAVERFDAIAFFWCPQENAAVRAKKDRVQYPLWIQQKHIRATPGNVVDYRFIRHDIVELSKLVDIQEIAYDRWAATQLVQELQDEDGLTMVEFGQGFASMSAPAQLLERLHLCGGIRHDANPCMTWQVSNVVVRKDPAGNIKPDKEKSRERIDGVVALVMALGRASLGTDTSSVYEQRGIVAI